MRNSTASILWILIFSFGVLWVLADTQVFDSVGQGPRSMGQVNGDAISIEEYNQRVSFYTEQFNEQDGGMMTAETRTFYEQQAWDDLVAGKLIQQKMNELGISVTDSELVEMISGDNPAPFIRQQFQQEDGTIDRIALRAAIESPENSEVWVMIEQQLRDDRRQQKLNNFIGSGLRVSNLDIRNEYIRDNSYANIQYIRFPYAEISDNDISVSEDEKRQYLSDNSEQFRRDETYQFKYVSWDTTPTEEDTLNTIQDVEDLRELFAEAEDNERFLERNQSQTSFQDAFVDREEIRQEYNPVLDLAVGEVTDVIMIGGDPYLLKKVAERDNEIKFATFSYPVEADPIATLDRIAEEASEFEFYASEEGFDSEAERRELEVQTANATKGSPFIPGIGQSQQTMQELEDLSEGEMSDPIELNDMFVVIQLLDTEPEGTRPYEAVSGQIESILRNQKRKDLMMERIQEMASTSSTIEELAEASDKEIQSAADIRFGANTIPGAGREPAVVGAIFGLEQDQRSNPIRGQNAAFVVQVNELDMADPSEMTTSDESEIREELEQQKFASFNEVFIDELKEGASIRDNRSLILQ
ncbi:MAG: SurA N-terminal domain-containing protein [Balneolaceae bacterium]